MDEMPPSAPSYPDGRQHRAIQQRPRTLLAISWTHVSQYRPAGAAARGNSANPARSSRSFPGGTACPLMAIPRGTCSTRTINAGPEVPAMRRPPAHRRGTKTGQLRAGRWPIQWDRGRFQSLWFWKPLESPSFPVPSCCCRQSCRLGTDQMLLLPPPLTLSLCKCPISRTTTSISQVEMVAKRALAPTMGISETALNSDSPRKGRGPWWGARLERALPRLLPHACIASQLQSPLRFASEKYWAATLLGNNELSATGALERAGPSHRVKGTSHRPSSGYQ